MFNIIQYWILRYTPLFFILMGFSLMICMLSVDINMWEWRVAQVGVSAFCVVFINVSYKMALSMDRREY